MATTVFAQKDENLKNTFGAMLRADTDKIERQSRNETQARMMAPFYNVCNKHGRVDGEKAISFFQEKFGLVDAHAGSCDDYEKRDGENSKIRTCKLKDVAYQTVDDWFVTCHCKIEEHRPNDASIKHNIYFENASFVYHNGEWKGTDKEAKKQFVPLCKPLREMNEQEKYAYYLFQEEQNYRSQDPHENGTDQGAYPYQTRVEGSYTGHPDPHYTEDAYNDDKPVARQKTNAGSSYYSQDPHENGTDVGEYPTHHSPAPTYIGGDPHADGNWR